jgi:hypothetical protein
VSEQEKIERNCRVSSRAVMAYSVILLWIIFAVFCSLYQPFDINGKPLEKIKFTSMAVYFLSLTGFIGSYLYGATVKPKENTSPIFLKGDTDKREIMIYICMVLWTILGVYGVIKNIPIDEIGAYFGALTPFVAGYILGETARHSGEAEKVEITETESVELNEVK